MLSARADSRKRLESGVSMRQDVRHKFGPQKGQVHAVDRSFDAVTSSSTETPHKTYTQVAPNPQTLIKPTLAPDTVKPSKSMRKARSAASPTKRTGPTGVSKAGAKGSIEVETASSVKVARAKAPRAREGGGSGSTSKSSVGAKETITVEIEDTNIDITPHRKAGDAVTKAGDVVKQEKDVTEVSSMEGKVKATGVAKRRTGKPLIAGEPRWTVTKPQTTASWKTERLPGRIPASELKPVVWTSSKEELLLALPELAKSTNGVAWLMAEAPVLVLEDREIGLSVSNVGLNGALSMELRMARDFACTPSDLLPPPPDLQNSPRDARAFRGARSSHKKSSPVSSGNASGHAFVSDSQKPPNHRRPPPSSPRKTSQGVYIVDSAKVSKVPKIEFNFDSLIVMAPESNDEDPLAVKESEVMNQAPTVARTPDSRPTNTDSGCQGSYGTFHDASHPHSLAHASGQGTPQGPASSLSLKRGPEAPGQAAEVPSKRIKMEPTEPSMWASSIPGLNSQQSQQILPLHGKPNVDQTIRGRPHTATQRSFGPGSSKTDVSTPLIHPAGRPSSTLTPHTPTSDSSMASTQLVKPLRKTLPPGLKFNKKPKVNAQGSSVQDTNGQHLSKPPITPSPDLPFGKPFHQQSFIIKDEQQEGIIPGPSSLPGPQEKASDRRFPFTLPSEVQVMLDAYVSGRAVVAIASRGVLLQHWNISLPCEFAYAFLGFFRVRRVWETEVAGPQGPSSLTDDHITGQVEWRFRCDWEPSADEVIASESSRCVLQPWWVLDSRRQDKGKGRATTYGDEDTDTESSVQYRTSRKTHPNYQYRRISLSQSYQSVLPRHVRAPDTPNMPDEAFPLGWLCENCGKLNYRVMLRHRTCTSSFCKDKPSPPSYALSLEQLREPQQGSPISHPYDAHPKGVEAHVVEWGDDMRTYTYVVAGNKDEGVTVKHIFTCNSEALQVEATKLLELFQLHIPMQRKIGKTAIPYFEYVISSTPGALQSPAAVWESAPLCAVWAKETLLYHGQNYGEKRNFDINKLSALAWVTSGTRKGPSSLQSKANSIIIMCLGADAVISVMPKSGFPSLSGPLAVDSNTAMLVDDEDTHPDPASKDEDDPMQDGDLDAEADIISPDAPKPARASAKPPKPSISMTLVHGDAMVVSGDDFEYSIKRSGTSILLIGSYAAA